MSALFKIRKETEDEHLIDIVPVEFALAIVAYRLVITGCLNNLLFPQLYFRQKYVGLNIHPSNKILVLKFPKHRLTQVPMGSNGGEWEK